MNPTASDALVFFGATGDLAYKKIFPALQSMVKRGRLRVPVIGVAGRSWTSDQFRARARESLKEHGGVDSVAFDKLSQLLGYVGGDYHNPATFEAVRKQLGSAHRPVFYLAIPPALFGVVVEQLAKSGCSKGARVIVEKPFGHDFGSAQELNRTLLAAFDESAIFRIDHYLGKRPVQNLVFFRFVNSFLEPIWNSKYVESVQITMSESIGVEGRGAFYDQTGTIRDVIQNHLFQVLANLAMEPPIRMDSESVRDEKVKLLKAVHPLAVDDMVRGEFRGYRAEKGVAADSKVETFAALRLLVNSWRWQGTPFYLRAGKNLPVSCTEVVVRLRRPPLLFPLLHGPGQLLPLPNRPRHDHRPWGHGNGPSREDVRAGGGTAGETPSHGGRDGRLRTAARRRDGGRRLLLRPRGLRGRGVAHRRSGTEGRHTCLRVRAEYLGTERS
jgi:glucose-6-phosphate 1-dehydrogenase